MQWCTKVDKYKIWMHNDSISAYKQRNANLNYSRVNMRTFSCQVHVCLSHIYWLVLLFPKPKEIFLEIFVGVEIEEGPFASSPLVSRLKNRGGWAWISPGDACMSAPHPLIGALIMWRHPNSQLHWCSKSVRVYIIMLYFQHCLILIFTLNTIMDQDWCAAFGVILWIEDWDAQLEESDCVQHRKYSDRPMQWRK